MRDRADIVLGDRRRYTRRQGRTARRFTIGFVSLFTVSYVFWAMAAVDERTRIRQALVEISRIEHATRLFRADNGRCPDDLKELLDPPGERLYLTRAVDPWGQPYRLICPSAHDPGGVTVVSGGPDSNLGGEDNISSF